MRTCLVIVKNKRYFLNGDWKLKLLDVLTAKLELKRIKAVLIWHASSVNMNGAGSVGYHIRVFYIRQR